MTQSPLSNLFVLYLTVVLMRLAMESSLMDRHGTSTQRRVVQESLLTRPQHLLRALGSKNSARRVDKKLLSTTVEEPFLLWSRSYMRFEKG